MILQMLEPAMKKVYDNEVIVTQANQNYSVVKRRLDEMDFAYKKVTSEISGQQDLRQNFEITTDRLDSLDAEMRQKMATFDEIQEKLNERFKFLKEDRATTLKQLDHIMHSIQLYRKDTERYTTRLQKETATRFSEVLEMTQTNRHDIDKLRFAHSGTRQLLDATIT